MTQFQSGAGKFTPNPKITAILSSLRQSQHRPFDDSRVSQIPLFQCSPELLLNKAGVLTDGTICQKCGNSFKNFKSYENHTRNCGRIKSRTPSSRPIIKGLHVGPKELNFNISDVL